MRNIDSEKPRYFVQSLAKGLSLLQAIAKAGGSLSLAEIADSLDTNKTIVTRLCYTLCELGFLQRDKQKRYHLTPEVLSLGYPVVSGLDWQKVVKHYLDRLYEEVHETVNLSILNGPEIQYVIRVRREKYLPFDIRIGTRIPVYCTAMGKVLMAIGKPDKIRTILKALQFKPLTSFTIIHLERFKEELETVRQKGYAVNDEELTLGNRAIAAPILDKDGYAAAAVNIAVPTSRYTRKEMEDRFAVLIMRVGQQISEALQRIESPVVMGESGKNKFPRKNAKGKEDSNELVER